MAKKKYYTEVYIDGKEVKVSDCKKIKGFTKNQNTLKSLAFLPGCSVSQNFKYKNKTMKIKVTNKVRNYLFE